jgi:[ribosomal protein S5]-alanine N-acetyltransferase
LAQSKVILRDWLATDAGSLALIANHCQIATMLRNNFPFPFSINNATDFIYRSKKNTAFNIQKAIIFKDKLVGAIGLELKDDVFKYNAEIGYWITPDQWGKGIATESVKLMIDFAFKAHPVKRIFAEVFSDNSASVRVLEKCSFEKEAILKNAIIKNGQFQDCYIFAIQNQHFLLPSNT